jgi:chorismate dehydratase
MTADPKVRIGMVNFINTAPLYDVWCRTVNRPDWAVVEAAPTVLNHMLYERQLDMGLVSSQEYAAHPEEYLLLDDISISAAGPIGSVFLFSKCAPAELTDQLVLLSGQSQTSAILVKIILENFYGVRPWYEVGSVLDAHHNGEITAVLAIGDEALLLAREEVYSHRIDLGKIWNDRTGLPFVFAVWAIRAEFCRANPATVREIRGELLRCRQTGQEELEEISRRVAPRVPMSAAACYAYLRGIEHDLDLEKKKGLVRFIEYLIERGEGSPAALPLKIFSDY